MLAAFYEYWEEWECVDAGAVNYKLAGVKRSAQRTQLFLPIVIFRLEVLATAD
jgi:hypothetical protein